MTKSIDSIASKIALDWIQFGNYSRKNDHKGMIRNLKQIGKKMTSIESIIKKKNLN